MLQLAVQRDGAAGARIVARVRQAMKQVKAKSSLAEKMRHSIRGAESEMKEVS